MFHPGSTLYFDKSGLVINVENAILGEGAFSTVYKASNRKLSTNSHYAVKKLLVQNEEISRSVKAEIRALTEFRHPNIIRLIDSYECRDGSNILITYLLFPLQQRGTLRDVLNLRLKTDPTRVNLDLSSILKDFKAICQAFAYMHTFSPVKYIHQDIKPEVQYVILILILILVVIFICTTDVIFINSPPPCHQ